MLDANPERTNFFAHIGFWVKLWYTFQHHTLFRGVP